MARKQECFICTCKAKQSCKECKTKFCSSDHFNLHRNENYCFPYKVGYDPVIGRHLVAKRSILAGEVIFHDKPLVVGPNRHCEMRCINCYNKLEEEQNRCKNCFFPLCEDKACIDGESHRQMCPYLKKSQQEDISYDIVLILKLLLVKNANEVSLLSQLMDHWESKSDFADYWLECEKIIHPLKTHFKEAEINRAIGLIDTNAHEITPYLRGIYPIISLLTHNCIRNSSLRFDPDFPYGVTCRANVDINEGESIFISYVSPLMSRQCRRQNLQEGWHFLCECPRCLDSADMTEARICKLCEKGAKLKAQNGWKCLNCQDENNDYCNFEAELEEKWSSAMKDRNSHLLQAVLMEGRSVLHPNHGFLQRMRNWVIPTICRESGMELQDYSVSTMQLKQSLCLESLCVLDLIEPGLNSQRGRILFELQDCEFNLAEKDSKGCVNPAVLVACLNRLSEATKCFNDELVTSSDGFYEASVQLSMGEMKNLLMQQIQQNPQKFGKGKLVC